MWQQAVTVEGLQILEGAESLKDRPDTQAFLRRIARLAGAPAPGSPSKASQAPLATSGTTGPPGAPTTADQRMHSDGATAGSSPTKASQAAALPELKAAASIFRWQVGSAVLRCKFATARTRA